MQGFLKSSLRRILKRFSVILFIDALDECGEELAVKLIQDINHLRSTLPLTDCRLGICFSCRHYLILDLYEGLTIALDRENNTDIATFVRTSFLISDIDVKI